MQSTIGTYTRDHGTDITPIIQLIPQIIINFRRHNTIGLQRSMMLLWACAGVPLGAYNVTENFNIALQIQPQILTTLSLITWIQCYYYEDVSLISPGFPTHTVLDSQLL